MNRTFIEDTEQYIEIHMKNRFQKNKLVRESIILGGVFLTAVFTSIAFMGDSREWGCTFVWQACLVQTVFQPINKSVREAILVDYFTFVFGIFLGIPIYSFFYYITVSLWRKRSAKIWKQKSIEL